MKLLKNKIIKIVFSLMLITIPTNFTLIRYRIDITIAELLISLFIILTFIFYFDTLLKILYKYKKFFILSFLFLLSLFISSITSLVPKFSVMKWVEYYISGLLFSIAFLLLFENGIKKEFFFKIIVYCGVFYSISGIIEALFYHKVLFILKLIRIPASLTDYPHIAGIFEWHTVFGAVMAFDVIISLLLFKDNLISQSEFIISQIFFIIGIVLSTSRNALLTVLSGIFLFFIFYKNNLKKAIIKKMFIYFVFFILLLILFYCIYTPAITTSLSKFDSLTKHKINNRVLNYFSSGRLTIIKLALNAFKQKPIFGIGIRVFPYYSKVFLHTHNIFLQFLTEGGLVGFILFLFFIAFVIYKGIKYNKKDELILIIIFFINQLFGYFVGHIYYFVFYMWFTISLIIYEKKI